MNARTPIKAAALRCAVYTRKSSEEGLEQSFNSLHAQREAGEAYVRSQAHEGWSCRPELYDDGGFSGGSMERPALKRLLADIAAGLVDIVVVYKIDRLTRSLTDFARIVEAFDARGVFVSVTQAFNTTSSMGRLTLNVLLSFAQFEREVTGERIRDKIAASKAKGLWMGGVPPLGYDARDRALQVNPREAETVRHIFRRYLQLGSVHVLRDDLERDGIRSKAWVTQRGRTTGGQAFQRGALYHLLQSRTYLGEVPHRELSHPGLHPPIVDQKLFEQVQRKLAKNRVKRAQRACHGDTVRLTGKLFDPAGRPYSPAFSLGRHGRRYGYYTHADLQQGKRVATEAPTRLPTAALDHAVLEHLRRLSGRREAGWEELGPMLLKLEVRAEDGRLTLDAEALFGEDHPDLALEDLQGRLLNGERLVLGRGSTTTVQIAIPGRLQFRGGRVWRDHGAQVSRFDPTLVHALKTAHAILAIAGLAPEALRADAQAPADAYSRRLARLALLSPDLQDNILHGRQPPATTVAKLMAAAELTVWADQRAALGGVSPPGIAREA